MKAGPIKVAALLIAALTTTSQIQKLNSQPALPSGGCELVWGLSTIGQLGADSGGLRGELRDQNRARLQNGLHLGGDCQLSEQGDSIAGFLEWGSFHDYHYYNPEEDRHDDLQYLRRGFMSVGYAPQLLSTGSRDTAEAPKPYTDTFMQLMPGADVDRAARVGDSNQMRLGLLVGRQDWRFDSSGLVYSGQSPLIALGSGWQNSATALDANAKYSIRLSSAQIERQLRTRRGLPDSKKTPAMLYVATLQRQADRLDLKAGYGFFRSTGRAAQPDLILSGYANDRVEIPIGQSARPDLDVHYYGMQIDYAGHLIHIQTQLWHNYGRQISVADDGTRMGSSRKSIQGSLAHLSLDFAFGSDARPIYCPAQLIVQGACEMSRARNRRHIIGLEFLGTTRDRDHSDTRLNGFGSIQPAPAVAGGAASIFLQGPPPGRERPPFANQEPYMLASDGGRLPYTEPREIRDNSEPALPDYANDGLRLGGLRYSFNSEFNLSKYEFPWRLDLHWNFADLRYGDGHEAILKLSGAMAGRPLMQKIYWQIAMTGASYTPHEREFDEWTGLSRRAPTRYYSRYLFSFGIAF